MKLVEDFSDSVDVDVSDSFQPFFQEWENVQELAGRPVDDAQKTTLRKLKRSLSIPPQFTVQGDSENEPLPELSPMRRLGVRRFSFGSENSLDVRDRKRSYEASMDTLWSSSSTFSINIDNKDDDPDEVAGVFIENALRAGNFFVGGSEPNLLDGRSREGTLSSQDYNKADVVEAMDTSAEVKFQGYQSLMSHPLVVIEEKHLYELYRGLPFAAAINFLLLLCLSVKFMLRSNERYIVPRESNCANVLLVFLRPQNFFRKFITFSQ